jgi:hypothetical protein
VKPCEACGHANLLNGEIVHASNCPVKYPEYAAPAKLGQLSRNYACPKCSGGGRTYFQMHDETTSWACEECDGKGHKPERRSAPSETKPFIPQTPGTDQMRDSSAPSAIEAIPEGCTPADAMVLREANHQLAEENHQLRRTLRFYAHGEHYTGLKHWEGPSGDDNWLCPPMDDYMDGRYRREFIEGLDEAMVEDGSLARAALRGKYLDMEGEAELAPVEGEPEWHINEEVKRHV